MPSFVEELWSSIFTPGPTPTLLLATNVTFAALQLVLFALLLGTHSIHFVVLSFLSGALWWSINWFAREVRIAQALQAEQEKKAEKAEGKAKSAELRRTPGAIDTTESETETESFPPAKRSKAAAASTSAVLPTAASTTLQVPPEQEEVRKRHSTNGDSSGYGSTDSEWEKVEDSNGA